MLLVGLTGGIGAGKTTVARLLAVHGAVVVDADVASRVVQAPGQPAFDALVERFGRRIIAADGTLDRAELARHAFASDEARRDLEAITHPAILAEVDRQIAAAPAGAVVVCEIPLLAESGDQRGRRYDAVVVVEAPAGVRLGRLVARGLDGADARRRIAAQASDQARQAIATHVVDNAGTVAALTETVDALWADLVAVRDTTEGGDDPA
jgi:dephospho-CoA kinase